LKILIFFYRTLPRYQYFPQGVLFLAVITHPNRLPSIQRASELPFAILSLYLRASEVLAAWRWTSRLQFRRFLHDMSTSDAAPAAPTPSPLENSNGVASPKPAQKAKLHGRAFYESLGSPKFILAPMVDQSEFVRPTNSPTNI
jgi:hypothetical protein